MSMVRFWNPAEEMRRLESEVSDLFRSFQTRKKEGFYPLPVDMKETNDFYKLKTHLPGFDTDEIDIEVTSQYIEIKAEKEDEETEDQDWILREIKDIKYRRRINLDKPINTDEAETKLKNGVLWVKMPKMEEAKAKKLIPETA